MTVGLATPRTRLTTYIREQDLDKNLTIPPTESTDESPMLHDVPMLGLQWLAFTVRAHSTNHSAYKIVGRS
jgi:hypothetical protein